MEDRLLARLAEEPESPCDRYGCRHRVDCAARKLQCSTFLHFVSTGKSCIPAQQPERFGLNSTPGVPHAPAR